MTSGSGPVREFPLAGANLAPALRYLETREALEAGQAPEPMTPRPAATVLLLQPSPGGDDLQVFMQSRVAAMRFAPGVTVFPGGGFDPRDADPGLPMSGPGLDWWSRRLGCEAELARGLLAAACREVFEECGVLLAGSVAGERGGSVAEMFGSAEAAALARAQLTDGELSLTEVLRSHGLELRSELLTPFARWVTPAYHPRIYDTVLFLARLPAGQHADGESTETEIAGWVRPADALRDRDAGRLTMLTPTVVALERIDPPPGVAVADWVAELERREWNMTPVQPELVRGPDGTPTLICEVP